MKIKTTIEFYLDSEVYSLHDCKSESEYNQKLHDVYCREYAQHGYQFDKVTELLSKTFKGQILLNIGDIVNICAIEYKVIEKEIYLDVNEIYYLLSSDLN